MSDEKQPALVMTPELFSEIVLLRAAQTKDSILETLAAVCEENDIDETKVKKMITAPLLSLVIIMVRFVLTTVGVFHAAV